MERDKNLEELFQQFNPDLGSKDLFMSSLSRKLEAIEYVKRVQDAQIHRYKVALLVAFIAGMVVSVGLIAFIAFLPATAPLFTFGISAAPFVFLEEHSHIIAFIILSLIASSSVIGISNTFLSISSLKTWRIS